MLVIKQLNPGNPIMYAWLIEVPGTVRCFTSRTAAPGIPINLHLYTRHQFLALLGRRVEIRTQLSPLHYTVRFPNPADTLPV